MQVKEKSKSNSVLGSLLWKFGERTLAQAIQIVVNIILARLVAPESYGVIALTTIFVEIGNVFVSSGFGNALVQKEKVDELDYSTVLIFGSIFSCLLYAVMFFTAPLAASYFREPLLTSVLRVITLRLPLAAFNSVQQAYLYRNMQFKKVFYAALAGTVISAVTGIYMAYKDFGVWALAAQNLSSAVVYTVMLFFFIKKWIRLRFSLERMKAMFSFGWNILLSDLFATIYNEIRSILIGRRYSSEQLAYVKQGNQIPHALSGNFGVTISSVLFPVMSREQFDKEKLRETMKKAVVVGTYIVFPIMAGMALAADPFIRLVYSDKWIPAIPFFQIVCIGCMDSTWSNSNLQVLKACGVGKQYFHLEIKKKSAALAILACSIPFGIYAISASTVVAGIFSLILTSEETKKCINYGFVDQVKDVFPNLLITLLMSVPVLLISRTAMSDVLRLGLEVLGGAACYILLSELTKNKGFEIIKNKLKMTFSFREKS